MFLNITVKLITNYVQLHQYFNDNMHISIGKLKLPIHNDKYHCERPYWTPFNHRSSLAKKKISEKIVIIFLSISLNMCLGCSKEPSH